MRMSDLDVKAAYESIAWQLSGLKALPAPIAAGN